MDKVRFKKGKFIPWLRISLFLIPLTTILFFAVPGSAPYGIKALWVAIAYVLWDTAYTMCDVPIYGLVTTLTDNQKERTLIVSIGRLCAILGAAVMYLVLPQVRMGLGGWFPTSVVFSGVGLLLLIPICLVAKERVDVPQSVSESSHDSTSFQDMLRYLGKNKYLLVLYGFQILSSLTNIASALTLYFARYLLGGEGMMTLFAALMIAPMLLATPLIPLLTRRFDKFTLFFWCNAATVVLGVLQFALGYHNFLILVITTILRAFPMGLVTTLNYMFTPDCAEYGHYRTGIRATGITFSVQTFTAKLTAALCTSLGLLALSLIGFVSGENAVQAAGFPEKLWFLYALLPAVGTALTLPLLWQYKLRDKDVQIMANCNSGKISREEARALLGGKYE